MNFRFLCWLWKSTLYDFAILDTVELSLNWSGVFEVSSHLTGYGRCHLSEWKFSSSEFFEKIEFYVIQDQSSLFRSRTFGFFVNLTATTPLSIKKILNRLEPTFELTRSEYFTMP